ncbi:MAG TPA: hypothetical protein PKC72_09310 [Chitinophagaceae bacterium]|nr:hypothetical protein [Chitinophagaceae bacterium]
MVKEKIENWPEKKEKLVKEFPQLTYDDLIYEVGKEQELLDRMQKKLKMNEKFIRKWLSLMG